MRRLRCRGVTPSRPFRPLTSHRAISLLLATLWSAGSACIGDAPLKGVAIDPPRELPSFVFTLPSGATFDTTPDGMRPTVLFFGYTHCPDYCPQTLAVLGQVRRDLGPEAARLRVVMVSADPERDRPEVLAAYLGDHQPDAVGLTGEFEAVTAVAEAFGAEFHKDPIRQAGGAPGGDGDYTVTHTGRLYLVDPQGQIRGSYLGALSPEDVAHDVRVLLGLSP